MVLLGALVPLGAIAVPANASTPAPEPAVVRGPVTMGSLQVVNALNGDQPMTLWIGDKVRARGVPMFSATSPIVVPGGSQRIRVATSTAGRSAPGAARVAGGSITIDVPPGTRRTLFVVGSSSSPRTVVVDALGAEASGQKRIVDLRASPNRSTLRVNGLARPVGRGGVSDVFAVSGTPVVSVDGVTTDARPGISEASSLLFVVDSSRGAVAGALTQGALGLDSLRSQIVPEKIIRQRQSLFGFFGSLALVITATVAAVSSMLVFRSRSREDRVRSLMASSLTM